MPTCSFEILGEESDDVRLVVRDENAPGLRSITNDAEALVQWLEDCGILRGRRLFYYDSTGRLDEIVHDRGRFLRFKAGPKLLRIKSGAGSLLGKRVKLVNRNAAGGSLNVELWERAGCYRPGDRINVPQYAVEEVTHA